MAQNQWPKLGAAPTPPLEHAAQTLNYLQALKEHAGPRNLSVPYSVVGDLLDSVETLCRKMLSQPDHAKET